MTPLQIFQEAAQRGLTLKAVDAGTLGVAPARLCPPEFAEILREHKPEILSILNAERVNSVHEAVQLHRVLTENERLLFMRWCGSDTHPLIFEAINLLNATIVE